MMTLSKGQVGELRGRLWPAACRAREWDAKDDAFRLKILSQIIHREIGSCKDIGRIEEYTEVRATLLAWAQGTELKPIVRVLNNPRRVLENKIKIEQVKLLAVLLGPTAEGFTSAANTEPDYEAAQSYVEQLMTTRFRTAHLGEISDLIRPRFYSYGPKKGQPTGEEKSDLECLRDTLDARINELRNQRGGAESGWSIHDLKTAAGVECCCATFCRSLRSATGKKEGVGVWNAELSHGGETTR